MQAAFIWKRILFLILAIGAAVIAAEPARCGTGADATLDGLPPKIRFTVFLSGSKTKVLHGDESIDFIAGRITRTTKYRDFRGGTVQEETIEYDASTLRTLGFSALQTAMGEESVVKPVGDRYRMTYREKFGAAVEESVVEAEGSDPLIVGKLLHHVIARNWNRLERGETASVDLMVPFKSASYRFEVASIGREDGLLAVALRPSNLLMRAFVMPMVFFYSGDKRLVRYEGPATCRHDGIDHDSKVTIEFSYVD